LLNRVVLDCKILYLYITPEDKSFNKYGQKGLGTSKWGNNGKCYW